MIQAYEDYVSHILSRFDLSSAVLFYESLTPEKILEIEFKRGKSMDAPKGFWKSWPTNPTTFPIYMNSGKSALHVASLFGDAMWGPLGMLRIETMKFMNFNICRCAKGLRYYCEPCCRTFLEAFTDEQKQAWVQGVPTVLEKTMDIPTNPVHRRRAVSLLRWEIQAEYEKWITDDKQDLKWSPIVEWCGIGKTRGGPTPNQKKILLALVENGGHRSFGDLSAKCEFDWENPRPAALNAAKRINETPTKPPGWELKQEDNGLRIIFQEI